MESPSKRLFLPRRWTLRWGECPHCGTADFRPSFEGRRGLSLAGILVLPLGRVRVHEECVACGAGACYGLKQWRSMRERLPSGRALELRDELQPDSASELLEQMVNLGEPEEFDQLADRVENEFADDAELLSKLAWCHGHFARFDDARRLFGQAHDLDPKAEREAVVRAYESLPDTPVPRPPFAPWQWFRAWLFPLLFVIGGGIAAWSHFGSVQELDAYVVNGLPYPYDVRVNDDELSVPANDRVPIRLGVGTVRVRPAAAGLDFEPFLLTLDPGQVARETAVVINPDRTAVISWEELVYQNAERSDDQRASADQFVLHVGEPFYFFDDVTDRFADPPTSFEVRSTDAETYRQVIHQLNQETPSGLCTLLLGQGEMELAEDFCRRRLTWDPDATGLLAFLRELAPDEASLAFMRGRLADRPLRFSWHRHYIDLAIALGKREALEKEYLAASSGELDNPQLSYLLGKTRADKAQAREDYRRSASMGFSAAHLELSLWQSSRGEFASALEHARAGLDGQSDKRRLRSQEREMLLALGQFDELIPDLRLRLDEDPLDQVAAMDLAGLAAANGDEERAQLVMDRFLQAVELDRGELPEEEAKIFRQLFAEVRAQWRGDIAGYLEASRNSGESPGVNDFILQHQYDQAAALLGGEVDAFLNLLLYALLGRVDELASAEVQLSQVLNHWDERGLPEQLVLASWFRAEAEAPSVEETLDLLMPNHQRRVLLVALAQRHPDRAESYLALARKLNYSRVFPYLALRRHLEGEGDDEE